MLNDRNVLQAKGQDTLSIISPGNQDELQQELGSAKQQFEDLLKSHQELQLKSKADIKVLVKEVKSLRNSQAELSQQLNQSLKENFKTQVYFNCNYLKHVKL